MAKQLQTNQLITFSHRIMQMQIKERAVPWCRKSMTHLVMYLMELGALKVHSLCSLSQTASHTKCHQGVWHTCYKPFKEELEQMQKMNIITPLGVHETVEWCNSFVLVPKANGKVRLCLDPVQLNQALSRPIHRGPTINDILPRLNNVEYMSIINVSLGYHNLHLVIQSSYMTTFGCPFGRYWYKHLPFGVVPAGDMFQCKIDKIFNDMPNVFGITDNILVIGYNEDGTDHDEAVYGMLRQCQEVNLKLNKDKRHFRCMSIPSLVK